MQGVYETPCISWLAVLGCRYISVSREQKCSIYLIIIPFIFAHCLLGRCFLRSQVVYMNSDMRSVGGAVAAPVAVRSRPSTVDTRRIEARWDAQALGPLLAVQSLPLIPPHISPARVQSVVSGSTLAKTDGGNLQIFVSGSLIRVSKPGNESVGGGLRSIIVGFSVGSRRRLMLKLAELARDVLPIFVTLTYPAEYPLDSREWKTHFDRWCKRLHRRYPGAGLVWRLEPQRRGAPHYHCLVYGVGMLSGGFRQWLAKAWYGCVGSGDPLHLRYGTYAVQTDGKKHVRSYISKYLAKVQPLPEGVDFATGEIIPLADWSRVGRWWGIRYGENLPWSDCIGGRILSLPEACKMMRHLRRFLKGQGVRSRSSCARGMAVLVDNPAQWLHNLDGLIGSGGGGSGSFMYLEVDIYLRKEGVLCGLTV